MLRTETFSRSAACCTVRSSGWSAPTLSGRRESWSLTAGLARMPDPASFPGGFELRFEPGELLPHLSLTVEETIQGGPQVIDAHFESLQPLHKRRDNLLSQLPSHRA